MSDDNLFVEQAEYIDSDSFQRWTTEHPDESSIIKKLSRGGAKLITGPRGCGKTTLLLKTFHKLCLNKRATAIPIYVNFKSSLKLEPLYTKKSNAVFWFNQWLLFKVYQGLFESIKKLDLEVPKDFRFSKSLVDKIINNLELGRTSILENENYQLSFPILEEDINRILTTLEKSRCVLLLDDAAHAFSPEQQRDFFDFFRQVKSRVISPKAAIYPGVTMYSATFHVGHDAEEIDVWIKPDSPNYIEFMFGLLKRRLPDDVFRVLSADQYLLQLVCYAAFGMPRALLNMIQTFYSSPQEDDREPIKVSFSRRGGLRAIKDCFNNTMSIYNSLEVKLPIYEEFVVTGGQLFKKMIAAVKSYNKEKKIARQSVTIAIKTPMPAELSKVLGFFQYGGLLLPKISISKGEKGVFEHYVIHYAALIDSNALLGKTAINTNEFAEALSKRNAHEYTRITPRVLIGSDNLSGVFPLSLPPCQACGTPRVSEHAKFCSNCGTKLKTASIFESLVSQDIEQLPLTLNRVRSIKNHSRIRTIKDILIDHDNRELRSVPQVGVDYTGIISSF